MIHVSKPNLLRPQEGSINIENLAGNAIIYMFYVAEKMPRLQQREFAKKATETIINQYSPEQQRHIITNKSYTSGLFTIALSDQPIGVDVERISTGIQFEAILQDCFTPNEINTLNENPVANFFCYWTRKESLVKATKDGITDAIKQIPCLDGVHDYPETWYVETFNNEQHYLSISSKYKLENVNILRVIS